MTDRFKLPLLVLLLAGGLGFAALSQGRMPAAAAIFSGPKAAPVEVALHKAVYDFKMISVEPGAGISGIDGKMYYEQDDACDAWTSEHRFTVQYQYPERGASTQTSHYVAWEAKDQSRFYFNSERQEDGETAEQLRGSVDRKPDGTATADYVRPENLSYDMPSGYLLPTMHTNEIIRHARAGDTFFNAVMFDGTDADGPVEVNTFIGARATPQEIAAIAAKDKKIDAQLLSPEAWHVHLAVFPLKDKDESMPVYEMEMLLHANGVVSHVIVDYQTFKIEQNLLALEKIPAKKCP